MTPETPKRSMDTCGETRRWLVYALLGMIADVMDTILSSVIPARNSERSIAPSDVDHLSDQEILELWKNGTRLHPDHSISKLTPKTIAKPSQDREEDATDASEANTLNLLFAETTIPIPRVRRVVKRQWDFLIVMDYIPGPTLARVWPTLSTWQKIHVAFTLRRHVRQLRRLRASALTPPGPLSTQGPRICESPIFGQVHSHRGPFASYSELSAFFNQRHQMAMDAKGMLGDDPSRNELFDNSDPLVLTHQDLNLRNIIVGEDGRLWIIDWGWAGYYPPWFEYVAMQRQNEDEWISGTNDEFWKALIPFICGPYFRQERWLDRMSLEHGTDRRISEDFGYDSHPTMLNHQIRRVPNTWDEHEGHPIQGILMKHIGARTLNTWPDYWDVARAAWDVFKQDHDGGEVCILAVIYPSRSLVI